MSRTHILRIFHIVNHAIVVLGLFYYFSWQALIVSVAIYSMIGCFGISIGYHRMLSHKSFKPKPWFRRFCIFFGFISTGGSPISWVAAHRVHHRYVDTERDVHWAKRDGWLRVYFHLWKPFVAPRRMIRDLLADRELVWIHRNYFRLLTAYVAVLYVIDFRVGLFAYSIPAVMAFHFYGLINVLGHREQRSSIPGVGEASNSRLANLFTFGEGWHRNHHLVPASYRIGFFSGEADVSARILETLPVCDHVGLSKSRRVFEKRLGSMLTRLNHGIKTIPITD